MAASSVVGAVLVAIAALPACSHDDCRVPLDHLDCSATFDQQVQRALLGDPIDPSACPSAGPCGSHLVWRTPPGLGSLTCVYDATGQELLSAANCTDVMLACGSLCMTGGQSLDVDQDCKVSALPAACPNGDGGQGPD